MYLSVRQKGIAVIVISAVTTCGVMLGALQKLDQVSSNLAYTNQSVLPWVDTLGEMENSLSVAHAESIRLIMLYMSGVKGPPAENQAERSAAAMEHAESAFEAVRIFSELRDMEGGATHWSDTGTAELMNTYVEQRQSALDMAAIDPSTGRLLYTAADNTFANLIQSVRENVAIARTKAIEDAEHAEITSSAAIWSFKVAALAGITLTVALMISQMQAIVSPLGRMTDTMRRLSADDLDVEITSIERPDELGDMARALQVFRDNVVQRQMLEQRNAMLASQDAKRREEQQHAETQRRIYEERQLMTTRLRQEFGEVIGAASRGDFTKRIQTEFADENLDALSSDINRLVTTMDNGVTSALVAITALAKGEKHIGDTTSFSGAFAEMLHNIDVTSQQIRKQARELRHLALHDALTELPNRRYLKQHLESEQAKAQSGNRGLALLHIDLDQFKQINDTMGHAAGDDVLQECARILERSSAPDDFIARIGGDEFVVLCAADITSTEDFDALSRHAQSVAARIVELMAKPIWMGKTAIRSGASVGIATTQSNAFNTKELLINADLALYEAKAAGRRRVHLFTPNLQTDAVEQRRLSDDIVRGLEADEFEPYFQPQIDARTFELVGFEALARWHHPTKGVLSPFHFLDMAETIGALPELDRRIMSKATTAMDGMRENHGLTVPRLSLNFGISQLQDAATLEMIEQIRSPHYTLCIELLESIFFDRLDDKQAWIIDQIVDRGVEIELDDFGSGHASISSLMKLRPHRLKIDKNIIAPLGNSKKQHRLVGSIIDMARALDIGVIAEGVETLEQADILAKLGCPILQGYAFAPALQEEDAIAFALEEPLSTARGA